MGYLAFMHLGNITRNNSKEDRELKQYAKSEGLSWWGLVNNKKKKKK